MKISTKGRYGLIAIMDMAIFSKSDIVTLKSISERQNISERYLEQIFSVLKKGFYKPSLSKISKAAFLIGLSSGRVTVGFPSQSYS